MSLKTYPIELPESAFSALRKSPAEFVQEMKYAAVVKWYEAGLARYEVSAIPYTPDLLEEELRYARGGENLWKTQ